MIPVTRPSVGSSPASPIGPWLAEPSLRVTALLVAGLWAYGAAVSLWIVYRWLTHDTQSAPAFALLVPPQAVLALLMWAQASARGMSPARRLGWSFMVAATVFDILGAVDWSYFASVTREPFGTPADALYMINYALLTAAACAFFVSCGGSFRQPRVWVDAAIVGLSCVAALLPLLFSPLLQPRPAYIASASTSLGYALAIGITETALIVLLMQIRDRRRDLAMILFVLGISVAMFTDVFSIAANVRGFFDLGNFDHLCWCWADAWVGTALLVERARGCPVERPRTGSEPTVQSFLPVIAILVSLAIVLGAGKDHSGFSVAATAALLTIGAALVIMRQLRMRYEFVRLNAELAARQVEERLTELVRRSADMIAVVTSDGSISYLSPATVSVVGRAPGELIGLPVHGLFGDANAGRLAALLQETAVSAHDTVATEMAWHDAHGRPHTVQVVSSNQLSSPIIKGIVLTARDVTEHRAMEREVLEAASRERRQLATEVHEGIGQELTGIALMLRSLATGPAIEPQQMREALQPIVDTIGATIAAARALAQGLAPLVVVQGSLVSALQSAAAEAEGRHKIPVRFICTEPVRVGAQAAEQLYYIAREAVALAIRRRGCKRVVIELTALGRGAALAVWSDDLGARFGRESDDDFPHRLLGYRARLIGGSLRLSQLPGGGTRVEVTIPEPPPADPGL